MPLLEISRLSKYRSLAIWEISESLENLYNSSLLSDESRSTIQSFRNERKRMEWLAGRLAVKELIESNNLQYNGVAKDSNGKPILINAPGEISITHSFPYVGAIFDWNDEVGIDLEQPTPKLKLIANKFMSSDELKSADNDVKKLCVYWCAKETLYKIYSKKGLIFKENILINPFDLKSEGRISGSIIVNEEEKQYNLEYVEKQGYILVYNI